MRTCCTLKRRAAAHYTTQPPVEVVEQIALFVGQTQLLELVAEFTDNYFLLGKEIPHALGGQVFFALLTIVQNLALQTKLQHFTNNSSR